MIEYDAEWDDYYSGLIDVPPNIKVGHTVSPLEGLTGCAIVSKVSDDNSNIELLTDFGNIVDMPKDGVLRNYRITGIAESVINRVNLQIKKLESAKSLLVERGIL